MANFKSDLITAKDQVNISDKMVDGNRLGGLTLYARVEYTLLGTEATSDTIQLFDLPPQARLSPGLSFVQSTDPGTTLTLNVGDATSANRYAQGIVLSAGGQIGFGSGTQPSAVATVYQPANSTRVVATIASAATLTPGVKLVFMIGYIIKG